ncbi:uncharacterized protein [Prorops nasuta]|uniref:uncharacterized protein n=1 Tax=Prorops nasuta TaxID=863751 RepID=UPI0034CDCAF4
MVLSDTLSILIRVQYNIKVGKIIKCYRFYGVSKMEILKGKRGCNIYAHNDYCYNIDKRDNITYRCNTRASTKCPGAVKFKHGKICLLKEHNHPPSKYVIEISKLKEEMLALCRDTVLTAKEIFDSVCRKYPTEAAYITFPSIKSTLNAERLKNKPKNPTTLAALPALMMNYAPVMPIYKGTAQIGSEIAVIFSTDTLMDLLASSTEIFVDGTFSVLPSAPSISQLYSVHVCYKDMVLGITTMLILCSSRTSLMYSCMWDKILELIPQLKANLKYAMIDFEKAAINALQLKFPDIKLHGCWFHYKQALLRKWVSLGLKNLAQDILLMATNLALAPASCFTDGIIIIEKEIMEVYGGNLMFLLFLKYLKTTWLPISTMVSVYNHSHRTNNIAESFHNIIAQKIGKGNKSIWTFLDKLQTVMLDEMIKHSQLKVSKVVKRFRSKIDIIRDMKIKDAQNKLQHKRITLKEFLLFNKGTGSYN